MNSIDTVAPDLRDDLFQQHVEDVWNHAYRLTGAWDVAEDVTTATFATAGYVRLVRDSALPWLLATAGTVARDMRPALGADPVAKIAAAVRALPKSDRAVAELCLLGEVAVADAATVLGLAESAARTRLTRAETRLRTALEGTR